MPHLRYECWDGLVHHPALVPKRSRPGDLYRNLPYAQAPGAGAEFGIQIRLAIALVQVLPIGTGLGKLWATDS